MGGLMHLFDFNQVLAGRKLLTDKKSGSGLESSRNSLDAGLIAPEVSPQTHMETTEEFAYGYGLQKSSTSRKSNKIPIKTLIAQELSTETNNKNRSPSVVARLMGLEALPTDSKRAQVGSLQGKIDEKFTQRSVIDSRQRRDDMSPHSVRLYAKKVKDYSVSGQSTPKSSYSQLEKIQHRKPTAGSHDLRNHPQEQQLQDFKREFEAWQSQKVSAHSKRVRRQDERQVRMPVHAGLPRERQMDANTKVARSREAIPSQKVYASEERLHESREFQDALDFLQSNKEFFMRFLHEPNSLFAKHLHEREPDYLVPSETAKWLKHRRSQQQSLDTMESPRPLSWARESPVSRQSERIDNREDSRSFSWSQDSPVLRSPGAPLTIDKSSPTMRQATMVIGEESSGVFGTRTYANSPVASQSSSHQDHHIPTRIVVLKPSPGRVRNSKSSSFVYSRSPKDNGGGDTFREDNADVLERLREKLRKDTSSEYNRTQRKSRILHLNEDYRDSSKDPREIAREIARQVRENITRDLMADARYSNSSNVQSNAKKKNGGIRSLQVGNSPVVNDAEHSELSSRSYWDGYSSSSRASFYPEKNFESEEAPISVDQKAFIIEQVKRRLSNGSASHVADLRSKNAVLDRDNYNRDRYHQVSVGLKSSSNSKASMKFRTERSHFSQESYEAEEHLNGEMASGMDHYASAEGNKIDLSQSMALFERGVAETKVHVHGDSAKINFESGFSDRLVHLRMPISSEADSDNRATLDSMVMITDPGDNFGRQIEGSADTIEGTDESLPSDEVAGLHREANQQIYRKETDNIEFSTSASQDSQCDSLAPTTTENTEDVSTSIDDLHVDKFGPEREPEPQAHCVHGVQYSESDQRLFTGDFSVPNDGVSASISSTHVSHMDLMPVKEQPEQPSPVSVLDLSLQDESSVATEFKELSSDLEELRMRLRLLNFDNSDQDLDNDDGFESGLDTDMHQEEGCIIEGDYPEIEQTVGDGLFNHMCVTVVNWQQGPELNYVKDILVASGFLGDSSSVLAQWHAPGQPLDPHLYEDLEKKFSSQDAFEERNQAASASSIEISQSSRRLLFDSANEALQNILCPYLNRRVLSSLKFAPPMPTGRVLQELIWKRISSLLSSHSGSQETLENLVTKDLGNGNWWLDTDNEIESAGLELEKSIFNDLIEESLLVL
ncbi:hypothetical protein KP509_15G016400 [Ceratopteris richardii]|nr:hypothetical protein KP509_15G016400 [Ceratopteris richardii]KAH7404216.1 hypothetical protein KP509_15G016400 [Ceratopteris richardii]